MTTTPHRRSHGATCPCGRGRGRPTEAAAMRLYWTMTKHLGLTQAPDFIRCEHQQWHWTTRRNT